MTATSHTPSEINDTLTNHTSATYHFGSIERILKLVSERLGMNAAYVTHYLSASQTFEVIAVYSESAPSAPQLHQHIPAAQTFCQTIVTAHTPEVLIIPDTRAEISTSNTAARMLFPKVLSYIGVPIFTLTHTLYGVLSLTDICVREFNPQERQLLITLAEIIANQINAENELTLRRQLEIALSESEKRHREFIEFSPDPIFQIQNGIIKYSNPAGNTMLGGSDTSTLIGTRFSEFLQLTDIANIITILADPLYREVISSFEVLLTNRDGVQFDVDISGFRTNINGNETYKIIARDITERKRTQRLLALLHSEQQEINAKLEFVGAQKSLFISIVSHEFRTALTGIQGFSELMRDENFSASEIKEFSADINEDAKRLNRMITEMLDLDRIESGMMKLHKQPTDINSIIEKVVLQANHILPVTHSIITELIPLTHPQLVDRDRMIQVFTNLLSNAIKYSPDGGAIRIINEISDGTISYSIQDEGIGLSDNAIKHIFERYHRDSSTSNVFIQGTGLGLPITRQLVELHGGTLQVTSSINQGSTFTVSLPYEKTLE